MDISITDDFSIICDLMFQLCGVLPGSFPILHSVVLVSTGRLLLLLKLFPHIPQETASCPCESSCGPSSCRSEWTVSRTVNKNTASPLRGLSWSSRMASWSWTSSDFFFPTCRFSRGSLSSSDFGHFLHVLQVCSFTPVWILRRAVKSLFWPKLFPQNSQEHSFYDKLIRKLFTEVRGQEKSRFIFLLPFACEEAPPAVY